MMGAMAPKIEPVGMLEIAERLGVAQNTVPRWRIRSQEGSIKPPFPEPRWRVSGYDAWNWDDVEKWAKASGRLP